MISNYTEEEREGSNVKTSVGVKQSVDKINQTDTLSG